jgi:hypothetical protein
MHGERPATHRVTESSMINGTADVIPWDNAQEQLANADGYWLATVSEDGRPHVMRILAVWASDALHFCTSPASRKGRNLGSGAPCVISTETDRYDLVLEGDAVRVTDEAELLVVADAYDAKYGWRVTVRGGAFQDAEGAPTAGPPPYYVYRLESRVAFGFGTGEDGFNPTRWSF